MPMGVRGGNCAGRIPPLDINRPKHLVDCLLRDCGEAGPEYRPRRFLGYAALRHLLYDLEQGRHLRPVERGVLDCRAASGGGKRVRVCALKKSEGDMEKTLKWMNRNDNKKQRRASQGARRFSEYVALVTSLPEEVAPEDVLAAYRYRWQVELYFKCLKSLLGAGEVPKKRAERMKAWLDGKMILAVLFEVLLSKLDFSPPRQG